MKKPATLSLTLICLVIQIHAQIIHIPADKPTIQAGIDSASNGDTVVVAEDTYYENINFLGKAITVASEFILDGDTSHISKTIIDGSQSTNPDTASTVLMVSGEDTTSVLTGFTITGGSGTNYRNFDDQLRLGGGGIFIEGSGGKIVRNIVKRNEITETEGFTFFTGGGIFAWVYNGHSVVIRKNIISGNIVNANVNFGGGLRLRGGRIICENNEIINNTVEGTGNTIGGGIFASFEDHTGVIKEAIVRNNFISGNKAIAGGVVGAGGYFQGSWYGGGSIDVYNNIICNNHSTNNAGGVMFWDETHGNFYNNTVVNNTVEKDAANNMALVLGVEVSVYNNIIWSINDNDKDDIMFLHVEGGIYFFNNMLKELDFPETGVTAFNNQFTEPIFEPDSFKLAEGSPGIAWGIDSLEVNGEWFYAPPFDYYGNPRPHTCDNHPDLGAVESEYLNPYRSNAHLSYIGYEHGILYPDFHRDTLDYEMAVLDTTVITPLPEVVAADALVEININHAADITSAEEADRTTTITVTADDGITDTIYTVLFRYMSSIATLDTLYLREGTLVPDFNPDTLEYRVIISSCYAPTGVGYEASCPYAIVIVDSADVPCSNWFHTTFIYVTAEDGITEKTYEIEFEYVDAVQELDNSTGPALYPNPFHSLLTINMNNNQPINKVEILSMDGRLVRIIEHVDSPTITLHRENLLPGMYFIRVYSDKTYIRKVMIR